MLTDRGSNILRNLIQEYTSTAIPVSSGIIARNFGTKVSSATVRNELVQLERDGYIIQPHTSAGRIPSAKGYRYYVETLLEDKELTGDEQRQIRHQFHQINKGIDELVHLSATILSRMLHNVAIVTSPQVTAPKVRMINLLSLKEFMVLVTVVFHDAGFKQQTVQLEESLAQEELNNISAKLTDYYEGLTATEIKNSEKELSLTEEQLVKAILEILDSAGERIIEDPHYDGLSQIMNQPEFVKSERAKMLMELLEERALLSSILAQAPDDEKLRIIIGSENPESTLHDFSIVLSRYGQPEQGSGVVGIVGPTRMAYGRTLPAVRFLSEIMSELLYEMHE
ncbi:MAG: heat-inducible transcription repressor HrcA [Deltaproteobacteria bacterium]|nr:heat-inducible transcription repressor HrcA [Deltaproteobacteria bacterium]